MRDTCHKYSMGKTSGSKYKLDPILHMSHSHNLTCHTLTWHTSRPLTWQSFQLVTPCKYSTDQWPVSRDATRLRQFNTNYFHLTGPTIKTVSPSDWDSWLCAPPLLWRRFRAITAQALLCFAPCLPRCRQESGAPITPNCSLANFPPRRPNRHRNRTRLQSKLRFVQMRRVQLIH